MITELHPELATAAPTNPPTRVCEELEGSPKPPCYQIPCNCGNKCRGNYGKIYNIRIDNTFAHCMGNI